MRATKTAIAEALRSDDAVLALVPREQIYAVERATIPVLPSVEIIAISSERVGGGPMERHELSVECTVSHPTEDGADAALDGIVRAVRQRLGASENSERPILLASGEGACWRAVRACWSCLAGHGGLSPRGMRRV